MVHLLAFTVTRIFASRKTMAGTATYLLQWALNFLYHNRTALNETHYAKE